MLILIPTAGNGARAGAKIERNFRSLGTLMNVVSARLERSARRNFREGGRPIPWPVSRGAMEEGRKTLIRSGLLMNSLRRSHNQDRATVFTRDKRAAIHQFGGTIVPVKAKALAIPIDKMARDRGPRSFPKKQTFLLKREGKAPLIMLKRDGQDPLPLYVLLKSVTIPARPFIRPTDHEIEEIRELIAGAVVGKK